MKKQVLIEINRNREIMGLELLLERRLNFASSSQWADFLQTYKGQLFDNVETVRPDMGGDEPKYDWARWANSLRKALYEKYGRSQILSTAKSWKPMAWLLRPDMLASDDGITEDVVLQPLDQKMLKRMTTSQGEAAHWKRDYHGLSLNDLVLNVDGRFYTPAQFCSRVNRFNIKNFGTTQIASWKYNSGDGETETVKESEKEFLYQFSASRTSKTRKQKHNKGNKGQVAAEGDPIPGGSAFSPNEVEPNQTKIQELLKAIQANAEAGNTVTNVKINGVASKMVIDKIQTWKDNVDWANNYPDMSDADIVKLVIGTFTEDNITTGNQVLAYLRAQNLGKELEKADVTVDSYEYSVGGDEMKADVYITTQTPKVDDEDDTITTDLDVDTEDLTLQSQVLAMVISVPEGKITWKHDSWKKSEAKSTGEEVIQGGKASSMGI